MRISFPRFELPLVWPAAVRGDPHRRCAGRDSASSSPLRQQPDNEISRETVRPRETTAAADTRTRPPVSWSVLHVRAVDLTAWASVFAVPAVAQLEIAPCSLSVSMPSKLSGPDRPRPTRPGTTPSARVIPTATRPSRPAAAKSSAAAFCIRRDRVSCSRCGRSGHDSVKVLRKIRLCKVFVEKRCSALPRHLGMGLALGAAPACV